MGRVLRRVVVRLGVRQRSLGLIARLPAVHGRLRAVVEAHMPPIFGVRLRVGRRWDSRMRRHWCHGILDAAAGRERSAQVRKRVLGRVRLDHRFPGMKGRERRVRWRVRRLPVFLHWRKPVGFMLSSVVDGCLHRGRRMGRRWRWRRIPGAGRTGEGKR
jgi:hypothetical protein